MLSGMLLAIGTIAALAAMATGFIELLKVDPDHPATRDLNRHMLLVMAAWCAYAASLFLRIDGRALTQPDTVELGLSIVGFVVLCVAGWFGGKLVYGYGLGVEKRSPGAA